MTERHFNNIDGSGCDLSLRIQGKSIDVTVYELGRKAAGACVGFRVTGSRALAVADALIQLARATDDRRGKRTTMTEDSTE